MCRKDYRPLVANMPAKGEFQCSCGHRDDVIRSIRRLPEGHALPTHPYAIEGYCSRCATAEDSEGSENGEDGLFVFGPSAANRTAVPEHNCWSSKNGGKFFKRVTAADLHLAETATATWEQEKGDLPYPKQAIPEGYNTNQMIKHNYRFWHQMFHPRQLLCLSTLLHGINDEPEGGARAMLLLIRA